MLSVGKSLNLRQAEALSNFFMDIAKGLVLGSLALSITVPGTVRLAYAVAASTLAYYCVKLGLSLLEGKW